MRVILLTFLLLIFGVLVYYSLQELSTIPPVAITEPFNTAPTRASDCRCLPGYIPANVKGKSGLNGEVYTDAAPTFYYFFVPSGTNKMYRIDEKNPCGISHIYNEPSLANQNKGNYPRIPSDRGLVYSGNLKCDMLMSINEGKADVNYFCQSLSDSQKTKTCY